MEHKTKNNVVLAVDLDETLTYTDTLYELLLIYIHKNPFNFFLIFFWLLKGKAFLKSKLSENVNIDVTLLPYNNELINFLKKEKKNNRKIILCTAANKKLANSIAKHLNLFDDVIASNEEINNLGKIKKLKLIKKFGFKGYDYAGNSVDDLEVWSGAHQSIIVNSNKSIEEKAIYISPKNIIFSKRKLKLFDWFNIFRIHQWLKNLLLFVPIIAAHKLNHFESLITLIFAFFSFSLCASAVYIINDLFDLQSDRKHPRKKYRPLAESKISIKFAILLIFALILFSFIIGLLINKHFIYYLSIYLIMTSVYSMVLKRIKYIDCLILALLYNFRIVVGAAAVNISLSPWLFTFSIFIFLSLAFVKRYAELLVYAKLGTSKKIYGRSYIIKDSFFIQILGLSFSYISIAILALYLNSETVVILYSKPKILWIIVGLMFFWVNWVWIKTRKGEMNDDPIFFIIKDKTSVMISIIISLVFLFATIGIPGYM